MDQKQHFDNYVLTRLISGADKYQSSLRAQLDAIDQGTTVMTGKGFYIKYVLRQDAVCIVGRPNFELGCNISPKEEAKDPIGFILFVRSGLISTFEGFSYGDDWPRDLTDYSVVDGLAVWSFDD